MAAEHSFVTQPTLSMQIQKLEDQLGVLIFNRSKKPIELTDVGEKVVEQAKVIVNESNRIVDIVHQYKGFIGGEFRLGIIPTVMPTLLPMFLNNFTKKYSKVKLIIEELTTEEIIKKLSENHLDAGLAATPLENEAIKEIADLREDFWENVKIPGSADEMNRELEKAGRVADFLELGELFAKDALHRNESCGGHFREEYATEEGEAKRNDKDFSSH